jgi:hypothetical protein
VLFKEEAMNIKLCRVSVMICSLLSLIPTLSGLAPQNPDASKTDQPSTAKQSAAVRDGSHDFDFIYGKWRMPNHRLKKRLAGSHEWVDFVTCDEGSPLPGGIGDIDYWKASYWKDFVGVTVRTYDPKTGLWRIYWVDNTFSGGII